MAVYRKIMGRGGSVTVRVLRYRLMCFQRPIGPWRASKEEAQMDALAERVATRERGMVWITIPAWIKESDPTPETEAGLKTRRSLRLVEVANPQNVPSRPAKSSGRRFLLQVHRNASTARERNGGHS